MTDVGPPVAVPPGSADRHVDEQIARLLEEARREPGAATPRANLGMAYEVAGMWQAALQSYEQAAALDPDEPRWSYFSAIARVELGDLEGGIQALDEVRRLNDTYVPAYLHRGNWLFDLGRVDEAFESFRRATALAPRNPAAWAGVARVHLRRGEPDQAIRVLERLIPTYEKNAYLHQLLGMAYRDTGDLERARSVLTRGKPQRVPGWPDEWHDEKMRFRTGYGAGMLRAAELAQKGRYDEVVALLEKLRKERPTDVALLNNLSVAYRRIGQPDHAFQVLLDGIESHPDYYPFHLNIGADYQRLGQVDKALEHYDRVIEISPTFAPAHQEKAMTLLRARRLEEAVEAFEETLRHDPTRTGALLYVGVLEGELGNWQAAADRLEAAVAANPNQSAAYIALGRAQAELGDYAAAEASLGRAGAISPQSRELARARRRLAELQAERP